MGFGEGLRSLRLSAKLTQSTLALRVGVSRSFISKVELGSKPSVKFVDAVANALDLPVSYLRFLALEKSEKSSPLQSALFDSMHELLLELGRQMVVPADEGRGDKEDTNAELRSLTERLFESLR